MKLKIAPEKAVEGKSKNSILTVPNILCFIRLIGSFPLFFAAVNDKPNLFLWIFIFLAATDWIDGKLAILLDQRSVFGAKLDTFADVTLYTALFSGSLILHWSALSREVWWAVPAICSYVISVSYALMKFGSWPSYHTRLAKTSWLLVLIGAVCFLSEWSIWPLKFAMVAVTITNIEAAVLTFLLPEWRSDIASIVTVVGPKYFWLEKGKENDRK